MCPIGTDSGTAALLLNPSMWKRPERAPSSINAIALRVGSTVSAGTAPISILTAVAASIWCMRTDSVVALLSQRTSATHRNPLILLIPCCNPVRQGLAIEIPSEYLKTLERAKGIEPSTLSLGSSATLR
jgi:hypothetical protein